MTIVEFLEARLAEDEQRFLAGVEADVRYGFGSGEIDRHPEILAEALADAKGDRILREVEAKRAILAMLYHPRQSMAIYPTHGNAMALSKLTEVTNALASIYADHPDYDQAWGLTHAQI